MIDSVEGLLNIVKESPDVDFIFFLYTSKEWKETLDALVKLGVERKETPKLEDAPIVLASDELGEMVLPPSRVQRLGISNAVYSCLFLKIYHDEMFEIPRSAIGIAKNETGLATTEVMVTITGYLFGQYAPTLLRNQ